MTSLHATTILAPLKVRPACLVGVWPALRAPSVQAQGATPNNRPII